MLLLTCAVAIAQVNPKPDSFFNFDEETVSGTTGTPLGGFGCGGIKFNASEGCFYTMTTPPADAYDFTPIEGPHLELSIGDKVISPLTETKDDNNIPSDDAIWPLHRVDFGTLNGIHINLTGISPYDPEEYGNMHLPYALYDICLTNDSTASQTAIFSFTWVNDPLLWSLKAKADDAVITTDTIGNELRVSAQVTLQPKANRHIHYVLAWYNRTDENLAYYMNLYDNPAPIAEHGLQVFDRLNDNAHQLVDGMRRSSLPHWLQNQTLNTLSSIVLNAMYKRDGRVAFAEGQWTCFGTMDQMWLARQIICQALPFYAWQELHYWARTQMNNGQIHHDCNIMNVGDDRARRSQLVAWDDHEHTDYRNIQKWVDLNAGFIISVYEAYRITGQHDEFVAMWPYPVKAGNRIFAQVEELGSKDYPYTFDGSENSYDAGGNPDPYNANVATLAFRLMSEMAQEMGEKDLSKKYDEACQTAIKSFSDRYIRDKSPMMGHHCENVFAGQEMALHMKLGQLWSNAETDSIISRLNNYYYPYYWGLGYPAGTYDEWTPYLLTHYGGLLLNTGRTDEWYVLQKDAYMRQYRNRDRVFAHALNILPQVEEPVLISKNYRSKMQYISIPSFWRNYYDVIGYQRDARTGEIWIRPQLHSSMHGQLHDAYFIAPANSGTIDYTESPSEKHIALHTAKPMSIKGIHLTDDFGRKITVKVNGKSCPYKRIGSGYSRELLLDWTGTVTAAGIIIDVDGQQQTAQKHDIARPDRECTTAFEPNSMSPYDGLVATKADKAAGLEKADDKTGEYFTSCNNFDYLQFSNVNFGRTAAGTIHLRIRNCQKDSGIEVVLDDTAGALLANCKMNAVGKEWQDVKFPIQKVKGIHSIILRFFGTSSDNLMEIQQVWFTE